MIGRPPCGSIFALAVSMGMVLLLPSVGLAQDSGLGAGLGAGAVAPGGGDRRFTIDVIGAILYDSNVSRGSDPVNVARDLHKSDVTYSPGVAAEAFLPLGQNAVFLNADVGYDFREYNKQLESARANIDGGAFAKLGPCQLSVSGGYQVQQSDLANLPIVVTTNRRTTRSVGSQLLCASSGGLTGFASAGATDSSNSADFNLVDSNSTSLSAGFGYGNRQIGTLQIIGGYTKTSYDESANPLIVSQPGYEAYSAGLQYSRKIGNRLQGSATIGFQTVRSESPLLGTSSNLSGSGDLTYRINSRASLNLAYSRGAAPSVVEGYDYILAQSIRAEGLYSLSSRLNASFGASFSKSEYKGLSVAITDFPADGDVRSLFAQVTLTLGRTASFSLRANQEKRTSTVSIFDYTAYQVGATAKKTF
jgi:hypothetical protein